jgi:hypothetical protein
VNKKLMIGAIGVAALGLSVTACGPSNSTGMGQGHPGSSASASASASGAPTGATGTGTGTGSGTFGNGGSGTMTAPGDYTLQAMPTGRVAISHNAQGLLQVRVDMYGLTPGSSHNTAIDDANSTAFSHEVTLPDFTADATGQIHTTLTSSTPVKELTAGSRFVVRLGTYGGDFNRNPVAEEPIADSDLVPAHLQGTEGLELHAETFDANGVKLGHPAGQAKIVYDAAAKTLTVTLNASGLNPGAHAAHIHQGSCMSQGPVKYMMSDFIADANGNIVNQTRVITGVTSVASSGWYLNLHQGGMNDIVVNGNPALSFRPLLCTDLSGYATSTTAPTDAPSAMQNNGMAPSGMTAASPSAMPSMSMAPSAVPTGPTTAYPTHF